MGSLDGCEAVLESRARSVCLLTSSHPVDYSRFLDREAVSLAHAGYHVTMVGLKQTGPKALPAGIRVIAVPENRGLGKLKTLRRLAQVAIAEKADLYHCYDPWSLAVGLWIRKARPGVLLVYDSTEHFPRAFLERDDLPGPVRAAGYALVRYLEDCAVRRAHGIIETNPTRARRFLVRGRKPVLVPNYPRLNLISGMGGRRKPWFAYTGLVSFHRGFDKLLQAFAQVAKRFPDARVRVAGSFDPRTDIKEWTRSYLRQMEIEKQVEFLGWLPYEQMFSALQPCSAGMILLQPLRWNDYTGQPNKLFEFMAMELAVIASDFPEMSRVISKTGCGWLVDPTDPKSIVRTLEQVLMNPAECRARGLRGREAAVERYNWSSAERALLALYEKVMK